MDFAEFEQRIVAYQEAGKKVFASSSFQTHSLPMLHMIGRMRVDVPVVFINTGYLFPQTLQFRDRIAAEFGLNVINVRPQIPRIHQRDAHGNLYFTSDTDRCCFLNKIQPMEPVLHEYDVWITGVRGDQSNTRASMQVEQPAPHGCVRLHPMLDWSAKRIHEYRMEFDLPEHPLEKDGYFSIGCEPCTVRLGADGRGGRWYGQNKTECGLHTDLAKEDG